MVVADLDVIKTEFEESLASRFFFLGIIKLVLSMYNY